LITYTGLEGKVSAMIKKNAGVEAGSEPKTGWPLKPRAEVQSLPGSRIREVANAGFGRSDILRFWFGESDQPTPEFIKDAAVEALNRNEVFYTHNNGREDLRRELSSYLSTLHHIRIEPAQISVTSSGVSALMMATQAVVSPGDRVVVVTPVWPNVAEIPVILSAEVVRVGLRPSPSGWRLDLDELLDAVTPNTRLLVINSPSNPTGWIISREEQDAILAHARKLGVWILADDVYERLVYQQSVTSAPSFLQIACSEDRVIGANSFSKAWLMTGWRLGWLVTPKELEPQIGKLIEFNTSCAPGFIQSAALSALRHGEGFVQSLRQDLYSKREKLLVGLRSIPGVDASTPDGGMYVFFRIRGQLDSVQLAKRLVSEAGLGLAPGVAFGPEGEGWMRWCFAAKQSGLDEGVKQLRAWAARNQQGRV
jgi:aspartate/methionine/tyrosine aminotransferase